MKHIYNIDGMTCQNCVKQISDSLLSINGVDKVEINLDKNEAIIKMDKHITVQSLQQQLPEKYKISAIDVGLNSIDDKSPNGASKLQQLLPLFLILFYISIASFLLHRAEMDWNSMMIDFMGLFFIVFSFFKMLDIKGFAMTFKMYDPIAKLVPSYGFIYPFIETVLGLMLLLRFNITLALFTTIIILGFTTYGVLKSLLAKQAIKCACLGTALNLPMTEATFIENAIMIAMSIFMLFITWGI